jgi:hypothetical protein
MEGVPCSTQEWDWSNLCEVKYFLISWAIVACTYIYLWFLVSWYIFRAAQWGCKNHYSMTLCQINWNLSFNEAPFWLLLFVFLTSILLEIQSIYICLILSSFHEAAMKQSEKLWRKEFHQQICWQFYVRALCVIVPS